MKFTDITISQLIDFIKNEGGNKIDMGKLGTYFQHRIKTNDYLSNNEINDTSLLFYILEGSSLPKQSKGFINLLNNISYLLKISKENMEEIEDPELKNIENDLNDNLESSLINDILKKIISELRRKRISFYVLKRNFNLLLEQKNIYEYEEIINKIFSYLKKDESIVSRIGSLEKYSKFCDRFFSLLEIIRKKRAKKEKKELLLSEIEDVKKDFSQEVLESIQIIGLPIEEDDERILSIDNPLSRDLDGAFSIRKEGECYNLKVYITNVPSFLKENNKLAREAYNRGNTIYIYNGKKPITQIHMLPSFLSCDKLSLLQGCFRNAIVFEFILDNNGNVENKSIKIKKINVNKNLSQLEANELLTNDKVLSKIQTDLKLYKEAVGKVVKTSKYLYINKLNVNKVIDLVAFSSILTNYYIGEKSLFAIYRVSGKYKCEASELNYTHSVTPLRKFVSNINLAFFLNQQGVESFDEKKLNYVENNIDEILNHLNYKEYLNKYVQSHSYLIKKLF